MLELVPRIPKVACEPLADGSIFPTYLLSRFARRHVTVALSGDGADELFAGYPTYRAAAWAGPASHLPTSWRRGAAATAHALLPVSRRNFSLDFKVKKFLDGLHPDPILRNIRWLGSFLPEQLPGLLEDFEPTHQEELEAMLHEPARGLSNGLEQLLRTDQRFYLQDGVLVKVDRASMAHALEVRVPFLDPDIVAFAHQLPADRKLAGRRFKLLLKQFARHRLPEAVWRRPKKGFGTPLAHWFRHELKELLGDCLAPTRMHTGGLFRPDAVARLLEQHWAGSHDHRKPLFNLLTFTLWQDHMLGTASRRARAS
jgi:asparagine synthase (glutamine-hydrolysing)